MMILGKRKLVAVKAFDPDDREDFEKEVAVQRYAASRNEIASRTSFIDLVAAKCGILAS